MVAVLPVEHPQLRPSQTRTRGYVSDAWLNETPISIGGACHAPAAGLATTETVGTTSDWNHPPN